MTHVIIAHINFMTINGWIKWAKQDEMDFSRQT